MKSTIPTLPFRPVSLRDFNQYAKALSRMIDEPLQPAQQLLACAYGYETLHDLQRVMQTVGTPGPFDEDQYRTFSGIDGVHERRARFVRLIAAQKGLTSADLLARRYAEAVELKLFDSPAVHRAARKWVFAALDIVEQASNEAPGSHQGIAAYARIELTENGEAFVRFTSAGEAIRDALRYVFPPGGTRPEPEFEEQRGSQRRQAFQIFNAHPDCPWPLAELIIHHARALGQGASGTPLWYAPLGDGLVDPSNAYIYSPCTDDFQREVEMNAQKLLPDVRKSVGMFERLYNGVERCAPGVFSPADDSSNFDVDTWPQLLYWGGKVAVNAGEHAYAVSLLKKVVSSAPDSSAAHWAREPLAALILGNGPAAVASCFPEDRFRRPTVWECMAMAASSSLESLERAAQYYGEAMLRSVTALEVFNDDAPTLPRPGSYTPDTAPECVREFMRLSAKFWEQHPASERFFRHMATHPDIQTAVLACHREIHAQSVVAYWDPRIELHVKKIRQASLRVAITYKA